MKKRFLTFVISCLLLAAFIGSAEAKKIDTTYDAGTGSRILAGGIDTEWAQGEPDGSINWLLTLYKIEDTNDVIVVKNSANSTDEALPTNEEKGFSLGDQLLLGYNLAGLAYGDRLLHQTGDTPIATDQTTGSGSTYEKVPVMRYETIPVVYSNPPTIVYTYTWTRPKKTELDQVKAPVSSPEKLPAVNPPDEDVIPPEVVRYLPTPQKPGPYRPGPGPDKIKLPDNNISSAPVPEPATMLLFSAGIAGLAFSSLRRNKNVDEKRKG